MTEDFTTTTTLRSRVLPPDKTRLFAGIKRKILGKKYQLSLVLIGDSKSHTLNKTYRNKDKPTNVLAFPLDDENGEIFINIHQARRETKIKKAPLWIHVGYLFIHACLHLKGYSHGATMEDEEKKLLRQLTR